MGNGLSVQEFMTVHCNSAGDTHTSSDASQPPSLESAPSTIPSTCNPNPPNATRAWLTVGLVRVLSELRKLFLRVFLETRRNTLGQAPADIWQSVIDAVIGTAVFPSEERFVEAWQFAFRQSPYAHIWELIDMDISEVAAMLAALDNDD